MNFRSELTQAIDIAREAGKVVLSYYEKTYAIWEKEKSDPVTEADIASNDLIIKKLQEVAPYLIMSEETKDDLSRMDSEYVWIVDPLDGTKDFMKKTDDFSVMIGLVQNGSPILGVVYKPFTDETFFAQSCKGAFRQKGTEKPASIFVSTQDDIPKMKLIMSRSHLQERDQDIVKRLGISSYEPTGSIGIKASLIAQGKCDLYFTTGRCAEWDICAPDIILQEAGGALTDSEGKVLRYNQKNVWKPHGIIASNGTVHAQIVQEIQKHL